MVFTPPLAIGDSTQIYILLATWLLLRRAGEASPANQSQREAVPPHLLKMLGNNLFPLKLLKEEIMGLELLTVVLFLVETLGWVKPTQKKSQERERDRHIFYCGKIPIKFTILNIQNMQFSSISTLTILCHNRKFQNVFIIPKGKLLLILHSLALPPAPDNYKHTFCLYRLA